MRRNSVYIAFILGGALIGERVSIHHRPHDFDLEMCNFASVFFFEHLLVQALNAGFDKMWEENNRGV
jgi:hypothetical protein